MEKLLENTPISFYWIGFILADGHISNLNRLKVGLSIKDIGHLEKLSKFLNINKIKINKKKNSASINKQHKIIESIASKFEIKNNKTYNPPNFLNYRFEDDLLISLIIGFIDGDGSITRKWTKKGWANSSQLCITSHINWNDNLKIIQRIIGGNLRINKKGYCKLGISEHEKIKELKYKAIELNLPILIRKWNCIDLNYSTKIENAKIKREQIKKLLINKSISEISKILNIPISTVSLTIKRHKDYYERK